MRLFLILIATALFGMALSALTAPEPIPVYEFSTAGGDMMGHHPHGTPSMIPDLSSTPAGPVILNTLPNTVVPNLGPHGMIYLGEPPKLETLEEHNRQMRGLVLREWAPCGIACPTCGKELEKNLFITLTSYPCQCYVRCSCGYRGTCN